MMNRRIILLRIGQMLILESILMVFPLIVSLIYGEWKSLIAFAETIGITAVLGLLTMILIKPYNNTIFAREGFAIVAAAWVFLSLFGALPFTLSGEIPKYVDAVFETVSGFTTTGATILTDVEKMSRGMLFWRSFTHWIGGMGVLTLIMAIVPTDSGRSMHIMRAEMAGPVIGKLVPKLKDTAKILYIIYLVLTVIEFIFLILGGMPVYDSLIHSLGTAGTGGFGIKADSLGSYSPYIQWVVAVFMYLFSLNFSLYYLLIMKKFGLVFKNNELLVYNIIVLVSTGLITYNIFPIYKNFGDSVRHSFFQVLTISSTSGFATADFNTWPALSKAILFILMFMGGCAGSTAGGLKLSRVIILVKTIKKDIGHLLHPRSVSAVKFEGKTLDNNTIQSVSAYFALYVLLIISTFFLISFEPFDLETNITAAVSCVNNVGPGLSKVGPMGGYADYSDFSTIVLTFAMLFGRLEIYPLLLALSPRSWFTSSNKRRITKFRA